MKLCEAEEVSKVWGLRKLDRKVVEKGVDLSCAKEGLFCFAK